MGEGLVTFFQNKIKAKWKFAFIWTFVFGILVYAYRFVNVLPNRDTLYNFISSQNMVASGRWFLSIACGFSSYFELPWVIGVFSVALIALTTVVVAEVFELERPVPILLTGGLLASFPAICATFCYLFTADGYMLAMLLAAISVLLTKINKISLKNWKNLVLSSVCICLSCGIYQAYVSFAFILAVCYFMMELLENRYTVRQYVSWILAQIVIYVAAMVVYLVIWKLCMHFQGINATYYHGIDQVGQMNMGMLLNAVYSTIRSFVLVFMEWNFFRFGVTRYAFLNCLFLGAFAVGIVTAGVKSGCLKKKFHTVLMLLCLVSIPFGCYIWYFVSESIYYHAVMLQSVCVLFVFAVWLYDRWFGKRAANLVLVLMCAIILNNSINANKVFFLQNRTYERTYALAVEVNTRIHLLDDGSIKDVMLYGKKGWVTLTEAAEPDSEYREIGPWRMLTDKLVEPMFWEFFTDLELAYYTNNNLEPPAAWLYGNDPAADDWESHFPITSRERQEEIVATEEFAAMPIWPAKDSVKVFGDTVVVKMAYTETPVEEPS